MKGCHPANDQKKRDEPGMRKASLHFCLLKVGVAFELAAGSVEFEEIRARAAALAADPFQPSTNGLPEGLRQLRFVQYQNIQFNHERALWREEGLPFQIEFFHRGWVHNQTVTIHEIISNETRPVPFSTEFFGYGTNHFDLGENLGFAGLRIVCPVKHFGELASFLGASYFRMIGLGQVYGTSARGLALNTGSTQSEEFPVFKEFWLRKPEKSNKEMIVFALMDSVSVAGAFQFVIRPGPSTVTTVKTSLFVRKPVARVGIAPLTSMFLYGENGHPLFSDFRPEVHDADGVLLQTGQGEWIWHPLEAGKMMRVNVFQDENPKGFGLMQRDRNFDHYQDLVARFQLRPSVWIKPLGQWGKGSVELVQLPTNVEFSDNTVAFWVPATQPKIGQPIDLQYEIHWTTNEIASASLGRVRSTRVGRVTEEPPLDPPHLRFVIDFEGQAIEKLSAKYNLKPRSNADLERSLSLTVF